MSEGAEQFEFLQEICEGYERLTGRPCAIKPFVVWRATGLGVYSVHALESAWFYEVKVKRWPE